MAHKAIMQDHFLSISFTSARMIMINQLTPPRSGQPYYDNGNPHSKMNTVRVILTSSTNTSNSYS